MSPAVQEAVEKVVAFVLADIESLVGCPLPAAEFNPVNRCKRYALGEQIR